MKNLLRSFVEAMNPCIHQWDRIDILHDDPKNPTTTAIVRMCQICGEVDTVEIKGPPKPLNCPPHRWKRIEVVQVWPHGHKDNEPGIIPIGKVVVFRCQICGEEMTRTMTADGYEKDEKSTKKRKAA